jgi:asparagine synthase (glutamine-hydrolysing)|tara:strand:- start:1654 stop:3522 length:1869 start_codon:yes stop_codon:yes gene_type:complete
MCGIAGIMNRSGAAPGDAVLQALTKALAHRGPDGQGRVISGATGLVHTRLAIIDLETGDQPLFASQNTEKQEAGTGGTRTGTKQEARTGETRTGTKKAALIANGEIYNYIELKLDMGRVEFRTGSDCEPPLHLYLRHGLDFTRHLRGMYAIAIYDPAEDSLVLARDPFGIKPLYYAETAEGLAFASEPQALFQAGLVKPVLRPEARNELLQLQFTTGAGTVFEGVHRLLPGETVQVRGGRVTDRLSRKALPDGGPIEVSQSAALRRLDEVLSDSVNIHQRSDVPYGMFLSGGIDSSALLAMMSRLNERPVQAFTAGFSGTDVADERQLARAVAEAAGADHTEVEFSEEDFWALLPKIAAVMDDPAADYAVLPTYKLAAAAKEAGLKVVLTGEGGDELFGGYGRYRRLRRARLLGGRPMRERGVFDGLGVLRGEPAGWRDGFAKSEQEAAQGGRTKLQAAQAADCADWLPHDLLAKLDRCLMAHGVEGRVPFLDLKVADFALRLPDRLKVRRGRGKWLLRKWLQTALPAALPFARKRGFTVPVGEWIGGRGRELGPLVASRPGIEEICLPNAVEDLFAAAGSGSGRRTGQAAWGLLFYALWHRRHIEGLEAQGGVFDVLGDKG